MKNLNLAQLGRIFGAKNNRSRLLFRLCYALNVNTEVF